MTAAARTGDGADARIIFRAGEHRFALATSRVRELVRVPRLTPVPLAPPGLLGLASVRGETLAILTPIEVADAVQDARARHLLVLDGADRVAIAVDAVERVEQGRTSSDRTIDDLPLDELIRRASPPRPASRRVAHREAIETAVVRLDDCLGLLCIGVDGQSFALPLEEIVEVLPAPDDIARLPGADEAVAGSILWRGETLGVLSLAALLDLPTAVDARKRIVVVALGGHRMGLLVDHVERLLRVSPDRVDPVPPTLLRSDAEARIRAICRPENGGKLISVLAADQLIGEARTRRLLAHSTRQEEGAVSRLVRDELKRFLRLRIGPHHLAFPLGAIEHVAARPKRCTSIPGAPAWLMGIAAVGGEPLAIVDQAMRLTGAPADGPRQRLIVARVGDRRLGFLVDDARTTVAADAAALAPAPLPEALAAGIFGEAFQLEADDMLLVVDPSAMISSAEQAHIDGIATSRSIADA